MNVSKEQNAENRAALLKAAERLFKAHGFDGVGVAEISKAAGLTHGGFYGHFRSKAALAAEACKASQESGVNLLLEQKGKNCDDLEAFLDFYLFSFYEGSVAEGCPMAAYATEVHRQPVPLQTAFVEGFSEFTEIIAKAIPSQIPPREARDRAITIATGMIGAVAIARASAATSPELADEILRSVRKQLGSLGHTPRKQKAARTALKKTGGLTS